MKSLTNAVVDTAEESLREIEKLLEQTGRLICDARDGARAWSEINDATAHVREAIRNCWRMRPLLLAVMLAVCGTLRAEVDYDRLLDAIAQVESDRGATSANVYQLRRIYVRDVWRVRGVENPPPFASIATDAKRSREYVRAYWAHYGAVYTRTTGKPVTAEVLARMHNGGPNGWRKRATEGYWRRVRRIYMGGAK